MKKQVAYFMIVLLTLLSACAAPAQPVVTAKPPAAATTAPGVGAAPAPEQAPASGAASPASTGEKPLAAGAEGLPLITTRGDLFNASGNCAVCHTKMTDMAGNDVSNDRLWRATMMANAARDPYWQASVRREVLLSPQHREIIEDKCTTCHMPMARFTAHSRGENGALLDQGFGDPAHELHDLAIDGVSCTLCHQVQPENFAKAESFSGGYAIDTQAKTGERIAYGPYPMEDNLALIMKGVSGFIPQQGLHIEESALCGTCHNLVTPYLDAAGEIAGEFPEQMVFSEWLNSSYTAEKTCQGCHMPPAQGGVQLSTTGGPQRSPFYQHFFVGGNLYLPKLFQEYGEDLGVTASSAQYDTTIQNVQELLTKQTATLQVENVSVTDGKLSFEVQVQSQVGHKFPAGFPARRAWLHVSVLDGSGKVVFESGAAGPDGSIQGNENDQDGSKYEPHYAQIEDSGQVQIYEAIMLDSDGQPTTTLLRAASYAKDNRLLPTGFDKDGAGAEIAVYGEALADADFLAGGDRVQYLLDLGAASGPFTIQVELLYQSISFRWAENLKGFDSAETQRFVEYNSALPNLPFVITQAKVEAIK